MPAGKNAFKPGVDKQMKIEPRSWQISIFSKLILLFLVVMLPAYFLIWRNSERGGAIIKNEISNSILSQDHFYLESFETEISRLRRFSWNTLQTRSYILLAPLQKESMILKEAN